MTLAACRVCRRQVQLDADAHELHDPTTWTLLVFCGDCCPDCDTSDPPGSLVERVRQIATDLDPGPTTHSHACWQWHDACALHRLIERTLL